MPVPKETPEINKPSDPKEPEVPQEDPQIVPDDFPSETDPAETQPIQPEIVYLSNDESHG